MTIPGHEPMHETVNASGVTVETVTCSCGAFYAASRHGMSWPVSEFVAHLRQTDTAVLTAALRKSLASLR